MLKTHSHVAVIICALSTTLAGCSDEKTDDSKGAVEVLDPEKEHYGKSYSEWNAEWYKWIYGIQYGDKCQLPVDDSTGEYCDIGQSSDVFFLAGSIEADKTVVVRDQCAVPADKPVFFPIMNTAADNGGVPPDQQPSDAENEASAAGILETVQTENLFASVDGEKIPNLERFKTDVVEFSYMLPEEPNFYTCLGATGVTGTIDPSYAGGYYVMLPPLSKGRHTIRFGLDQADDLYAIDITYDLLVE